MYPNSLSFWIFHTGVQSLGMMPFFVCILLEVLNLRLIWVISVMFFIIFKLLWTLSINFLLLNLSCYRLITLACHSSWIVFFLVNLFLCTSPFRLRTFSWYFWGYLFYFFLRGFWRYMLRKFCGFAFCLFFLLFFFYYFCSFLTLIGCSMTYYWFICLGLFLLFFFFLNLLSLPRSLLNTRPIISRLNTASHSCISYFLLLWQKFLRSFFFLQSSPISFLTTQL